MDRWVGFVFLNLFIFIFEMVSPWFIMRLSAVFRSDYLFKLNVDVDRFMCFKFLMLDLSGFYVLKV